MFDFRLRFRIMMGSSLWMLEEGLLTLALIAGWAATGKASKK